MVVTLDVSQVVSGWLKALARLKVYCGGPRRRAERRVTAVGRDAMGRAAEVARRASEEHARCEPCVCVERTPMFATLDVSQPDTFPLNAFLL